MSRKVKIDFSADTPVIESFGGEFGENAFVEVEVIPETEMTEMPDLSLYYVVFAVEGGVLPTSMFNAGEDIKFTLPSAITSQKKAAGQLWAQDAMGTILAKSPIFTLYLGDSVEGNIIDDPQTGDSIYTQLAALITAFGELAAAFPIPLQADENKVLVAGADGTASWQALPDNDTVKILKETEQGYSNFAVSQLKEFHEANKLIIYQDCVLVYSTETTNSIVFNFFDVKYSRQKKLTVSGSNFATITVVNLLEYASNNQGIDGTIKTINQWLTQFKSDIASKANNSQTIDDESKTINEWLSALLSQKVDLPSTAGTDGQALCTDGQGGTYWGNAGGSLPVGTNNGDILVWDATEQEWVSAPAWRTFYQPIEYIESTGTQYIDAGVKGVDGIDIDYKQNRLYQQNVGCTMFSSREIYNGTFYGLEMYYWNNVYIARFVNTEYLLVQSISDTNRHQLQYGTKFNNICYVDGEQFSSHNAIKNRSNPNTNFALFARLNDLPEKGEGRIYSAKLYVGADLVRDFIPVMNLETNKAGLFDLAHNKFYGNNGTEDFIGGNPV